MTGLIDYAGLFPPAQLPLEPAIKNYAAYQTYDDAWMLGRFIIPAARLEELDPYVSLFSEDKPLTISAIGSRSTDEKNGLELLRSDLEKIVSFQQKHGRIVAIDVLELPLPPVIPSNELLEAISVEAKTHHLQTFCEITMPLNDKWTEHMIATLDAIKGHNDKGGHVLGVKLRTGGVTAEAFPTPEQVAVVLAGCSERDIPQKFTAGLHHPIRMYREEVKTEMHGFLNVFAAGMLARSKKLEVAQIAEVLADKDPANFHFTENGISWKGILVEEAEMNALRSKALCSYGSCSFDEPREDLRALQII